MIRISVAMCVSGLAVVAEAAASAVTAEPADAMLRAATGVTTT
jgi:hypothetical protein